jgi:hypothetical protein
MVLTIGIVIGRFIAPAVEGRVHHGIQLVQDRQRGCSMFVATEKTILGRHVSTTEGSSFVACGQAREVSPEVAIICDCEGTWRR